MDSNDKYIGKLIDDRYEILDVIGEGGMAVVYKALCHRLNRNVAIKIMRDDMAKDEDFRRRFCAESHAVAMLSNPNIVAVYDVSHSDDTEYIVMELVNGITLKQYMEMKGAIAWKEVVHFSKQIARALAHAHERGIIHRDIKPQNIMLLRDGTIKVGDFGIAALENEVHENNGQAIGSIHYIAPEQARGECPDARSDIYSLGVVMYEMVTGVQPYTGDTLGEIAVQHMNAEPAAIHEKVENVPPELEAIVLKAMKANLSERYQSANELLSDLDKLTHSKMDSEEPESPGVAPIRSASELSKEEYSRRRKRASRVSYLSGTFGIIAVTLAAFVFLWNFWVKDIFATAERIELPNFVGSNYESLLASADTMSTYNFEVTFIVDTEVQPGVVLSQTPSEGRSMMLTPTGIEVELVVSTEVYLADIPDVTNQDYWQAKSALEQAGFVVEIENSVSDSITRDYVMYTRPAAGEQISTGSTVYLVVSSGPEILSVTMPNLVGLSEAAAMAQLESSRLSYGGANRVQSEQEAGTVIGQSIDAFIDVEEHSRVVLTISAGPG